MFWGVIASMYVGNVILLVLNLPLIGLWVQLLRVPYGLLFPLILLFCMIGVYSEAGNVWDIVVMLVFARARPPHEEVPLRGRAPRARLRARADGRGVPSPVPPHVARQLRDLVTRPLATTFIVVALAVMVLPAVLPSARAAVRMVGRETAE